MSLSRCPHVEPLSCVSSEWVPGYCKPEIPLDNSCEVPAAFSPTGLKQRALNWASSSSKPNANAVIERFDKILREGD